MKIEEIEFLLIKNKPMTGSMMNQAELRFLLEKSFNLIAVARAAKRVEYIEQCLCCDGGYEEEDCTCYDTIHAHDRLREALRELEKE